MRRVLQELPFYNVLIKKPRVKRVKNIDVMYELPFYGKLSIVQIPQAFKTLINFQYDLDKSFQENLFRVDNCINEGSGWVIASKDGQYVNISIFSPFSGSTYIELPHRLRNSMTGLINIKNNANKCFLWCHIRHLNSLKIHPERITKADKNMINDLDYKDIKFPVSGKDFGKIEKKNNICINVFCYENNLFYPVYVSDQKFEDCIDLLMITEDHIMSISKNLTDLCAMRQSVKVKKHFCKYCLQCFNNKSVLAEHRETCLKINGNRL